MFMTIVSVIFLGLACADYNLNVLHVNDIHAHFEQSDKYNSECRPAAAAEDKCFGGTARLCTKVKQLRHTLDNVILLHAGDQFQGTLWFNYYAGNASKHFGDTLQYDVMVCNTVICYLLFSAIVHNNN